MNAVKAKSAWIVLLIVAATHAANAFYNSDAGRWLNRDPIEERGGENLSMFLFNNPITLIDVLGRQAADSDPKSVTFQLAAKTDVRESPRPKACGDAKWTIQWKLMRTGGDERVVYSGWVVQSVKYSWNIEEIDQSDTNHPKRRIGKSLAGLPPESASGAVEYVEAWAVNSVADSYDRTEFGANGDRDYYQWPAQPGTFGNATVEGLAWFTRSGAPGSWKPEVDEANGLPSRYLSGVSALPSKDSNSVVHTWKLWWDCCAPNQNELVPEGQNEGERIARRTIDEKILEPSVQ